MTNPLNRLNKTLKTKEDMQSFVLIAFVLFIVFVKCYMLVVSDFSQQTANNHVEVKTQKGKQNI